MAQTDTLNGTWRIFLMAALIVGLLGLVVAIADAADTPQERLDRKVRVMERVIDEVLIQSKHVTVGPGRSTRGVVLDEFGALFTFDADVGVGLLPGVPRLMISRDRGDHTIVLAPKPPRPSEPGEELEREEIEEYHLKLEEWKDKEEQKQRENYAAFKTEVVDTLVDYGGTLTELKDDQWVAVLAFVGENPLFGGESGSRLMVKVKARDLRQYGAGSLSRDAVVKRVVVEER